MQKSAQNEFGFPLCKDAKRADEICDRRCCVDCDVRYHCLRNSALIKGDMEGENGIPIPQRLLEAVELRKSLLDKGYPGGMAAHLAGKKYGYTASIIGTAKHMVLAYRKAMRAVKKRNGEEK